MPLEESSDSFLRFKLFRFECLAGIATFNEDERRNTIGQDSVAGKRDWTRYIIAFEKSEDPFLSSSTEVRANPKV
jgi:hypothetical protein